MNCQKSEFPGQGSMTHWFAPPGQGRVQSYCFHGSSEIFSYKRGGEPYHSHLEKGAAGPAAKRGAWGYAEHLNSPGLSNTWVWVWSRNGSLQLLKSGTLKPMQCSAQRNLKPKRKHLHNWGICTKCPIYRRFQHCRLGLRIRKAASLPCDWLPVRYVK